MAPGRFHGSAIAALPTVFVWTFADFAVVSESPTSIKLDAQGLQHCADGPAVEYADGFKLYSWHGTRVPEDLIEGHWSAKQILKEPNTEIRRCAVEKMGWDAFIEEAKMEQVGKSVPDPGNPGQFLTLYAAPVF